LTPDETPPEVKWGVRYRTYVVNSPVYCAYLLRKFILNGGETREYTLVDPMEAFELAGTGTVRTVVNCSGLGFGDPKAFIIRGTAKSASSDTAANKGDQGKRVSSATPAL
jgi:D-amino-acid oxidase